MIFNVVRLLLLLIAAYLFGKPFARSKNETQMFYEISVVLLLTPLVFPHQGKYALLLFMPAYALLIKETIQHRAFGWPEKKFKHITLLALLIISIALITFTTDGLIGMKASEITQHLHLLTYGAFALFMAICFIKPEEIKNNPN